MALIYIVEDDASIREIETIALKNSGHEIYAFENAGATFAQHENGADDYLKKPFSIMELITRVKVLLRRCEVETEDALKLGEIMRMKIR